MANTAIESVTKNEEITEKVEEFLAGSSDLEDLADWSTIITAHVDGHTDDHTDRTLNQV
jgi:hypothetical protein